MSATSDLKMADYDIPVYPSTMRYNPQVKDHGIIIGCLIFHGLLMKSNHEQGERKGPHKVLPLSMISFSPADDTTDGWKKEGPC